MKTFVKTVYVPHYFRSPEITEYSSVEAAEAFVQICNEWGIGIVSCEIVEKGEAK